MEGGWDGIRSALQDGPLCPQFDIASNKPTGDEDCLTLNIYTPSVSFRFDSFYFICISNSLLWCNFIVTEPYIVVHHSIALETLYKKF